MDYFIAHSHLSQSATLIFGTICCVYILVWISVSLHLAKLKIPVLLTSVLAQVLAIQKEHHPWQCLWTVIPNMPGSQRLFSSYFVKISADFLLEPTPLCLNSPNTLSTALCNGWNLGPWTSMKLGAFRFRVWQCRSRPVSRLYNVFGGYLCPS